MVDLKIKIYKFLCTNCSICINTTVMCITWHYVWCFVRDRIYLPVAFKWEDCISPFLV